MKMDTQVVSLMSILMEYAFKISKANIIVFAINVSEIRPTQLSTIINRKQATAFLSYLTLIL